MDYLRLINPMQAINPHSKKGSAMVEAALVFPIVILTAITLLYIMLSYYSEAESISRLQIELRAEAGCCAETSVTYRAGSINNFENDFNEEGILSGRRLSGNTVSEFKAKGLISRLEIHNYPWSERIIDEDKIIRYAEIY